MRELFDYDFKNYAPDAVPVIRPSVRAIVIREGRVWMVKSLKYGFYKFPGGGMEPGETHEDTLIREAREEAGLVIRKESIRPYGSVRRVEKGKGENEVFVQENFYYFAVAEEKMVPQQLDDYEAADRFTPVLTDARTAINANRACPRGHGMLEREARVLEMLIKEGFLPG